MILAAVFTASLSSLFYEILLSYYFAEAQWNNLYFFVISISLFGYSAGGVIVNLILGSKKKRILKETKQLITPSLFILSAGTLLSYLVINLLGIDYFRIPFEKRLVLLLVLQYCILAIPFTAAGTIIAVAFSSSRSDTHLIYTSTMAGSAVGVLSAFLVIPATGVETSILFCSLLPVLPRFLGRHLHFSQRGTAILISAVFVGLFIYKPTILKPIPSSYKPLSVMLASRGTILSESHHSIHGRIDIIESPLLRASPGLSLEFTGTIPTTGAAVLNAGEALRLYNLEKDLSFASFSLPAAVSALNRPKEKALIIERGGGTAVPQAVAAGAGSVDIFQPVKKLGDILRTFTSLPGLRVLSGGARSPSLNSSGPYDLIYIDDTGNTLPGLRSLDEQFHLTVEAFTWYLDALSMGGIVILTRNLLLPPTDSVRLFSTLLKAFEAIGAQNPGEHLMMLRNWNTYTILASKNGFTPEECRAVLTFAQDLGFDMVYFHGIEADVINRFNVFEEPYYYDAIQGIFTGKETLHKTSPGTDLRPYTSSFLKLSRLKAQNETIGSRGHILLSSGEILVWILLGVAPVVATLFLILPVLVIPGVRKTISMPAVCYFSLLGLAFMFVETGFIKLLTLPLGDSLVSFSLVLSVILIVSAAGSFLGRRTGPNKLLFLNILLAALLLLLAFIGFPLVHLIMKQEGFLLIAGLLIITAVPAFPMGVPFPAGLRLFAPSPAERAYSWAANGVFSVLSSILAVPVSLNLGIPALFGSAAAAYLSAGLLSRVLLSKR